MDEKLFIALGASSMLMDIYSCFLLRELLWSIVWCDKGGKYNKLMKLKQGQTLISKIDMKYLKNHLHRYSKPFEFWLNIKRFHGVMMVVNIFMLSLLGFFYNSISAVANVYSIGYVFLSVVIALVCVCQFDINRNTKYDRRRMAN